MTLAQKINKIPEFYMIGLIARKLFPRIFCCCFVFFWGGGTCAPYPFAYEYTCVVYRYFFRKASDEFDSGVVHEELTDDDDLLPLLDGKVIGKVERCQ